MAVSQAVCDHASALDFLLGRVNYERMTHIPYASADFKLERMRRLLALLGDPHLNLKAVHVAGTKGKGSTAAMLAAVLTASGRRTGLYTSPHLDRIEERMTIDGQMCPEPRFVALAAELQEAVDRLLAERSGAYPAAGGPTFFEVTTAMAFLHFARANVDAAVLEVGLGGRLDSTNVCRPEVCVITSISFDHMKQLGHTLAAIAGEKAGIIKPGIPVISGVLAAEPREVITDQAARLGAPLFQRDLDFAFHRDPGSQSLDYFEPTSSQAPLFRQLALGMPGEHQAANAACAIAALLRLNDRGWGISAAQLRAGLLAAHCPGRIEVLPGPPEVILDVAHNPASVAALLDVLNERFSRRRKLLIFACSKDKDYPAMLRQLVGQFETIILTRYVNNPRAVEVEELTSLALAEIRGQARAGQAAPRVMAVADALGAWQLAGTMARPSDLICITGSFFLAAELRTAVLATKVVASDCPM